MRHDREMAIQAMRNLGWQAERDGTGKRVTWVFRRPDTGGLWDVVRRKQSDLSMGWVAEIAMQYHDADDLVREVAEAKERWLRARFLGIYSRAETELAT